jgi:uncharacterized peroxidase-related enzyme
MSPQTTQATDAYIRLPSPDAVAASQPANHPYNFGFVTGMGRLLAAHERIGAAFLRLFAEIMFAPGALDRREREFIAAVAASAQNCFYWTTSHAEFLRAEGGEDEVAAALHRGDWASTSLSPRQRALGTIAYKLSLDPHTVGPEDWAAIAEMGFDDEGCLEIAHIVGIFNHLTRLADGFGLRNDPATLAAASGGPPLSRWRVSPRSQGLLRA